MNPVTPATMALKFLFFGNFTTDTQLQLEARKLVSEYQERGYSVSGVREPLRIRSGRLPTGRGGLWQPPDTIILSEDIQERQRLFSFLRHELIHVIVDRNCRLPLWAQEATAMAGSGELTEHVNRDADRESMSALIKAAQNDFAPADKAREALASLILKHGWPIQKCAVSAPIQAFLKPSKHASGLSWRLIHLTSGKTLQTSGNQKAAFFPGSLLKVPFAASISATENRVKSERGEKIGHALALSDKKFFLNRIEKIDHRLLSRLLGKDSRMLSPQALVGLREGKLFTPFSLTELTRMLRLSVLISPPELMQQLSDNGELPESTLKPVAESLRSILREHKVAVKTGTTRNADSMPVSGSAMLVWPADNPQYLAVLKEDGIPGFLAVQRNAALIRGWINHYARWGNTNTLVKLNHDLHRTAYRVGSDCEIYSVKHPALEHARISSCGVMNISTRASKRKSKRQVSGIVGTREGDLLLLTDVFSYTDGVIAAEAATELRGEARSALQAVVAFNALARNNPTQKEIRSEPLCSSTRCMVFQGDGRNSLLSSPTMQKRIIGLVGSLTSAGKRYDGWLPFSLGGTQSWRKMISSEDIARRVSEPTVLSMTRERSRNGKVKIHLEYVDGRETVPCEIFRNTLKLLSCPQSIKFISSENSWLFSGVGEGHGEGLQMLFAQKMADEGRSADEILKRSFRSSNNLASGKK